MGKKSRIVPRTKPKKVPPPKPQKPKRARRLSEFKRYSDRLSLRRIRPCGPSIRGLVHSGSWEVKASDEMVEQYLEVLEDLGNEKRLYHGTKTHVAGDISTMGLRKGKGGMFGGGIYFGMPEKAIVFASPGWKRWRHDLSAMYMYEADVVLGKPLLVLKAEKFTLSQLEEMGNHSVHGRWGYTHSWGGTLRHDEWVVYSPDQVLLLKLHEYQRQETDYREPPPTSGTCAAIVKDNTHSGTFADVLNQKTCAKAAYNQFKVTPLKRRYSRHIWVCADCIKRLKLRENSKLETKSGAYRRGGTETVRIVKVL